MSLSDSELLKALDYVPEIAEDFGIARSEARRRIFVDGCPCGYPGENPCWRVGGEAGCALIGPGQPY